MAKKKLADLFGAYAGGIVPNRRYEMMCVEEGGQVSLIGPKKEITNLLRAALRTEITQDTAHIFDVLTEFSSLSRVFDARKEAVVG